MAKKWLLKIFKMEWQKRWYFAIPSAIRWIEMAWISNSDPNEFLWRPVLGQKQFEEILEFDLEVTEFQV